MINAVKGCTEIENHLATIHQRAARHDAVGVCHTHARTHWLPSAVLVAKQHCTERAVLARTLYTFCRKKVWWNNGPDRFWGENLC